LQAAYAAPLILLAQTRQADRDAAHALSDAEHREALHSASEQRAPLRRTRRPSSWRCSGRIRNLRKR
jgi:uncharacterized membrane protein